MSLFTRTHPSPLIMSDEHQAHFVCWVQQAPSWRTRSEATVFLRSAPPLRFPQGYLGDIDSWDEFDKGLATMRGTLDQCADFQYGHPRGSTLYALFHKNGHPSLPPHPIHGNTNMWLDDQIWRHHP